MPDIGWLQARRGFRIGPFNSEHLTEPNRSPIQGREAASPASRVRLQFVGPTCQRYWRLQSIYAPKLEQ